MARVSPSFREVSLLRFIDKSKAGLVRFDGWEERFAAVLKEASRREFDAQTEEAPNARGPVPCEKRLGHREATMQRRTTSRYQHTWSLVIALLCGAVLSADALCAPGITITSLPPFGVSGSMQGTVSDVDPSQYRVALFIPVPGVGWFAKPTGDDPRFRSMRTEPGARTWTPAEWIRGPRSTARGVCWNDYAEPFAGASLCS